MLKSISTGFKKTYVGYTNDLKSRLDKHNSNKGAKSTKNRKWKIIYKKKFTNKNIAISLENKLKNDNKLRNKIKNEYLNA